MQYLENNGTPISMEYCTLIETCRTSQRTRSRRSYYMESTVGPQQKQHYCHQAKWRSGTLMLLVVQTLRAQGRYKFYYDRKAHSQTAFVRFPQDETGKRRKLSRPWHGPYRVTDLPEPDVCLTSINYSQAYITLKSAHV